MKKRCKINLYNLSFFPNFVFFKFDSSIRDFRNFSVLDERKVCDLTYIQNNYGTQSLSMLSIDNRKNILLNFCKVKDISLVNDSKSDNNETPKNKEEKAKEKIKIKG